MSKAELAAFLTNHAPVGMRHPAGEDVIGDGGSDGVADTEYDVLAPADPTAYTGPSLLV